MMTGIRIISAAMAIAYMSPALAQVIVPSNGASTSLQTSPTSAAGQAVAVIEAIPQQNILRAGTEVPLLMREELTTRKKQLRVGQRFQMEVAANVVANGVTVIPAGTPAIGEITEVRNKGMWGKSGYIGARVISLRMGDRHIRLTGTFDDKGVTGTGGVVAAVALVPLAGFFTTGTSAMIASGSSVKAFLDEDIAFRAIVAQPQVLEVPVAAPVVQAPVAGGGLVQAAQTVAQAK
jgi:hypothetical protein